MLLQNLHFHRSTKGICYVRQLLCITRSCSLSQVTKGKFEDGEEQTILNVLNSTDSEGFLRYSIAKTHLKRFIQWRKMNGTIQTISDLENIEGFTERNIHKLCSSILSGGHDVDTSANKNKIRGSILHPALSETVRKNCKSVLGVYTTSNSVSWTLVDRGSYEVVRWHYFNIEYKNEKKMQINDIFSIAWQITQQLPTADIYVMKAESTTLRAAGSDPNNPKVLSVNLQKSQLVSILVALINARRYYTERVDENDNSEKAALKQNVYFLRPSLPFRLYGTLVGNEKVSTEQTVEMILRDMKGTVSNDGSHVSIPESLQTMFRGKKDLEKDMLGHCLLLAMTFMDLCIYKNEKRLNKLLDNDG